MRKTMGMFEAITINVVLGLAALAPIFVLARWAIISGEREPPGWGRFPPERPWRSAQVAAVAAAAY